VPIVVLGSDALLAASPATPVQLAHACLRAGFANVVPASWGDELVAAAALTRLPNYGNGPVIQCSCPIVAHRLLTVGGDLRPVLLALVSPPVAVARYVRLLAQPTRTRITYVGACPGAMDESIDIRMTPDALLAMLAERDIIVDEQPQVFESVIPPDRRRYRSQPGGVPTAEALWTELGARTLVEVDGDDFIAEIAQHLLSGKNVLIDASARLGCVCSGAVSGVHSRSAVVALEPPRAATPIVDEQVPISLDLPVPATSRTPVDIVALPATPPSMRAATPPLGTDPPFGNRYSPVRASGQLPDQRPLRPTTPIAPRSVLSAFPVARDVDGRSLPRAYVARRRSAPKGVSLALPPEEPIVEPTTAAPAEPPTAQHTQLVRGHVIVPSTSVDTRSVAVQPVVLAPEPAPALSPATSAAVPTPMATTYTPDVTPAPVRRAVPQTPADPIATPQRDSHPSTVAQRDTRPPRQQPGWTFSRAQLVGIIIAVAMIAISVSTVVAILVGRSVSASAVPPVGR
jgi:hypothetical protein